MPTLPAKGVGVVQWLLLVVVLPFGSVRCPLLEATKVAKRFNKKGAKRPFLLKTLRQLSESNGNHRRESDRVLCPGYSIVWAILYDVTALCSSTLTRAGHACIRQSSGLPTNPPKARKI
jgi:predicted secreted protein